RGDVARRPADAGERAVDVDRAPADRQGTDAAVRVRVPGSGGTRRAIERGDPAPQLPADTGERAAGVNRAPAGRQGTDLAVRVRVPGRGGTRCRIERCDVVARHPADP